MCNDNEMHPIRGQVLKVVAPWVKHFYIRSESESDLMYIFPRSDCVVLGGSAEVQLLLFQNSRFRKTNSRSTLMTN